MLDTEIMLREIVSSNDLLEAWNWLVNEVQPRPEAPGQICVFNNQIFQGSNSGQVFRMNCRMLGNLYIASQFGNHREIIRMAHGFPAPDICYPVGNLDRDARNVLKSKKRFRHHLSEHLSFWIRLAVEKKSRGTSYQPTSNEFVYSKPNIQPEDKGPDGLYLEIAPGHKLEIQSVKSSINNPQPLISSSQFRRNGKATPKKMLDDFWLFSHKQDGLLRLDDLLDRALSSLDADANSTLRLGLVRQAFYNAVAVANEDYSREQLFLGYEHVTPIADKRIATFIGHSNWETLSTGVQNEVRTIFRRLRML